MSSFWTIPEWRFCFLLVKCFLFDCWALSQFKSEENLCKAPKWLTGKSIEATEDGMFTEGGLLSVSTCQSECFGFFSTASFCCLNLLSRDWTNSLLQPSFLIVYECLQQHASNARLSFVCRAAVNHIFDRCPFSDGAFLIFRICDISTGLHSDYAVMEFKNLFNL